MVLYRAKIIKKKDINNLGTNTLNTILFWQNADTHNIVYLTKVSTYSLTNYFHMLYETDQGLIGNEGILSKIVSGFWSSQWARALSRAKTSHLEHHIIGIR